MEYSHTMPTTAQSGREDGSIRSDSDLPEVSLAALLAENTALRSELAMLQVERSKLAHTQGQVMELLGVQSSAQLIHDIRNLLNERALLKSLVAMSY